MKETFLLLLFVRTQPMSVTSVPIGFWSRMVLILTRLLNAIRRFIYWKISFPGYFKWNAKKRLNNVYIKKLLVFHNFESKAFSGEKAFFEPKKLVLPYF